MDFEIELWDENDYPYTIIVEVEYDCTPEEYEAGYYFAGGVEVYCNAKVLDVVVESDDEGNEASPKYKVGDNYILSDDEMDDLARNIRDGVVRSEGRYPRMNISPDW